MQVLQKLDERHNRDVCVINYSMKIWSRISVLLFSVIWWFCYMAYSTKLRVIILEIISVFQRLGYFETVFLFCIAFLVSGAVGWFCCDRH